MIFAQIVCKKESKFTSSDNFTASKYTQNFAVKCMKLLWLHLNTYVTCSFVLTIMACSYVMLHEFENSDFDPKSDIRNKKN